MAAEADNQLPPRQTSGIQNISEDAVPLDTETGILQPQRHQTKPSYNM